MITFLRRDTRSAGIGVTVISGLLFTIGANWIFK